MSDKTSAALGLEKAELRERYLEALHAADSGDFSKLAQFVSS